VKLAAAEFCVDPLGISGNSTGYRVRVCFAFTAPPKNGGFEFLFQAFDQDHCRIAFHNPGFAKPSKPWQIHRRATARTL
jgi:hypothetical protein